MGKVITVHSRVRSRLRYFKSFAIYKQWRDWAKEGPYYRRLGRLTAYISGFGVVRFHP